jgi:ArsR family transcriptional regulator
MAINRAFRALADPTRRRILRLLRGHRRTSGEIAEAFDSSWPRSRDILPSCGPPG